MWQGIYFNNVDLSTLPGVQILSIDSNKRTKRITNRKKLAKANGSRLIDSEYDSKVITIEGIINGADRPEFERNSANLFKYLEPQEGTLTIPQGGESRNYVCTVEETTYQGDQIGTFAQFTANFVSSFPYGEGTGYITAINATGIAVTPSTQTFVEAIKGTFVAEPLISYTLTAVSSANASDYVTITNPATGQYIKVARSWSAGDRLVVDCSAKSVVVNDASVDFSGVFPTFSPGAMYVKVEDSFSVSRSANLRLEYKKRDY